MTPTLAILNTVYITFASFNNRFRNLVFLFSLHTFISFWYIISLYTIQSARKKLKGCGCTSTGSGWFTRCTKLFLNNRNFIFFTTFTIHNYLRATKKGFLPHEHAKFITHLQKAKSKSLDFASLSKWLSLVLKLNLCLSRLNDLLKV